MKNDIINSFNKIAKLEDKWDHNRFYEKLLLKEIKTSNATALDIGCGTGEFTQELGKRVSKVCGIDLSPRMIDEANNRHKEDNIDYIVQDFEELSEDIKYDYIVSIATFHHLSLEDSLPKISRMLKNNGKLIVLDIYERRGIVDMILDCIAVPLNFILQVTKKSRMSDEEILAWNEHSRLDKYEMFRDMKKIYWKYLGKSVKIKRLLLWRYIMIYTKMDVS